jgi:hypothetical protein
LTVGVVVMVVMVVGLPAVAGCKFLIMS